SRSSTGCVARCCIARACDVALEKKSVYAGVLGQIVCRSLPLPSPEVMMQQKILPAPLGIYQSRRPSNSFFLKVRGLDYHIRTWGPEDAPAVVLLHGGQDGSAT